jgi:hypothetical protein
MCMRLTTYDKIKAACESLESCVLTATFSSFNEVELCSLIPKQLFVQYQCVDEYILVNGIQKCSGNSNIELICPVVSDPVNTIYSQTWCDGATMTITCPANKKIQLICSYYGVHPSNTVCSASQLNVLCYIKDLFMIDIDCSGLNTCTIGGVPNFITNLQIDNPCDNLIKSLFVQWKCV